MATQGLFGPALGEEEMARQLLEQRAMQFAQMPQSERLAMMGYQAGNQLGSALAGAFGVDVTDPLVKRARRLEQLRGQVDTTTPEGLRQLASLLQKEDPDTALKAVQMAQQMELQGAKIDTERSTAEKNRREKVAAEPMEQFIRANAKYFTPASLKAYKDSSGDPSLLDPIDKTNNVTVEAGGRVKLISRVTGDTIKDLGTATDKSTKVSLNGLGQVMEQAFAKAEGGKKAENWQTAGQAYTQQSQILPKLEEVERALPKTFTGAFADQALQLGKAMSALGVPVDETKITNTEYLNSVSSQLLQTIARNFPGSLAVKEMEQLIKSKPSSQQQVQTISRILRDLRTEMQSNIITYENLSKLPEKERYNKDYAAEQGRIFRQLSRYHELERKALSATPQKPMTKQEVEEAKRLKEQLGI